MDIQSRPVGPDPLRIDLTRPIRDAIHEQAEKVSRTPPDAGEDASSYLSIHKRAKFAREKLAAQGEPKTEPQATPGFGSEKRIAEARDRYNAKVAFRRRVKNARANYAPHTKDKLAFSPEAKALAADAQPPVADPAATERVADLKVLADRGHLNTADLIALTAYRMLGGE
jgi:hypothetical protein